MHNTYLVVKSLHIISIISWMAGLLYLPRLFIYHCQAEKGGESDKMLQVMERKLLRYIMNPAMIASFIFGLWLVMLLGKEGLGLWFHLKCTFVLLLSALHGFFAHCRTQFVEGNNTHSAFFFRIMNELPTLLMVIIVFLVILKP